MVSWTTIQSLAITLGPFIIPRLIAFVRSVRASQQNNAAIRPPPPYISRALNILFASAAIALLSTLPYFAPENIFKITKSRLQTPTHVTFNRLAAIRPLTALDEALQEKLSTLDGRLQYLTFGPEVVATCSFCRTDDPNSYLYYALPSILSPHILHTIVLGFVTSSFFSGSEGARWRNYATIAGVALAVVEAWLVGNFNRFENARAIHQGDVVHYFWSMRVFRGIAIAAIDGLLGWALWLTSTNRWLAAPLPVAERLEATTKGIEIVLAKLNALSSIKNGVVRDRELRVMNEAYWTQEGEVTTSLEEDRDVVDVRNNALARINVQAVTEKAMQMTDHMFSNLENLRSQNSG